MRFLKKTYIIFGLFVGILILMWSYFIEPNLLTVQTYRFAFKELAGLRIVYLTDLHAAPQDESKLEKLVAKINAQKPDLVLLGGDYVKGHKKESALHPNQIAEKLSHIQAPLGIYGVFGNHDAWYGNEEIKQAFEKHHIFLLENQSNHFIYKNRHSFDIAGVADLSTGNPELEHTLSAARSPVILLTHSPDIFPQIPNDVFLTLAGHTHGGQIKVPFWGAVATSSAYGKKYAEGLIEEDGKKMIVSRGIGTSILPLRFNCLPEIVIIDITK